MGKKYTGEPQNFNFQRKLKFAWLWIILVAGFFAWQYLRIELGFFGGA